MRKRYLLLLLPLLVFALASTAYSWQGRMGGMGDPYGLFSDESDFLIHPAKIADGEGVRFYGGYRFTYRDVMDWDYDVNGFDLTTGVLIRYYNYDTSGNEQRHEGLLGVAFPLGPGREGLFFEYRGTRGRYDGNEHYWEGAGELYSPYDLQSDLDDFTLRLLYGLPVGGGFSLGGELQFSYRQEENATWQQQGNTGVSNNCLSNGVAAALNLFPFMIPYDSEYWEVLLKGSIDGSIGPVGTALTLRGGYLLGGDNTLESEFQNLPAFPDTVFDLDGTVEGWRVGGDLWVQYPFSHAVSLPFLARIDYQEKGRDGDCITDIGLPSDDFSYEHKEKNFEVEAGGGVDARLGERSRIAAGLYYSYRDTKDDYRLGIPSLLPDLLNNSDYPTSTEHRVILRLAEEEKLSSTFVLRYGLEFFYGWVQEDFNATNWGYADSTEEVSLDGNRWGVGLSLGGTLKFRRFTLEPFINAGYQGFNLDGDGKTVLAGGTPDYNSKIEQTKREWFAGGGLSLTWGSQGQEADQVSVEAARPDAGEEYVSVRRCPQCGRTFEADYVFCPYDKTELEVVRVKK